MVLTGWQPTENWLEYNSLITQGSLKRLPLALPDRPVTKSRGWAASSSLEAIRRWSSRYPDGLRRAAGLSLFGRVGSCLI
jgi:hypothetical protein